MKESDKLFDFLYFGNKAALIGEAGETVTYADLHALSVEISRLYGEVAFQIGTRPLVLMLAQNSLAVYSLYAAMLQGHCTMMLVSANLPKDMLLQILNSYKPALMLLPENLMAHYPSMTALWAFHDYRLVRTNFADCYPIHPELALLATTSGSTGSVKFVRQSWNCIHTDSETFAEFFRNTEEDRIITTMPLNYLFAQCMTRCTLLRGGSVVVTRHDVLEEEFWNLIEKMRVTMLHGVPNIFEIMRRLDMFSEDFSYLKVYISGGGKLSKEMHAFMANHAREAGKLFYTGYGSSEAGAITSLDARRSLEKVGSVGRPLYDGACRLIDENGQEILTAHMPGEIEYHSSNVAMGYAQCGEDLARGDEWNGMIRTGDIAEMDEDGDLYIVGRMKRFIKVHGHRISLDEIEARIMEGTNILAVCVGEDDHPVIWITNPDDEARIKAYLREKLPVLRTVARCAVIDEIPRTEAGKIRYGLLQEKALELG